ncbi:hypothetical protein ACSNO4_02560 [Kocuria flava]|uniref:hypothetical protein n=1 Tax=Kocuria flava TaxID=446860 RepID=UPI003F1B37B2
MLDEYFHVRDESSRIGSVAPIHRLRALTETWMDAAQSGGSISFAEVVPDGGRHRIERRLQVNVITRFGRVVSEQSALADTGLRNGLNLPF